MQESTANNLNDLLREGIAAARAGQREQARDLLLRAVVLDDTNVQAWLWLGMVADTLEDREVALGNALSLAPGSEAAQKGLVAVRRQKHEQWLREGIAAARAGQRTQARELLTRLVDEDEGNVMAWLWLSGVVDGEEDRELCLDNVLALDPGNEAAVRGLEKLRREREEQLLALIEPEPEADAAEQSLVLQEIELEPAPESPVIARAKTFVTAAAAILHEDFAARLEAEPEPEPPAAPSAWQDLEDEYRCPYCAALTRPDDRNCPACGQSLWVKFRRREQPSRLYWLALFFQLISMMYSASAPFALLIFTAFMVGAMEPFELLNAYVGLPSNLPPEVVARAFAELPRIVFWLSMLPFLYSATILLGLYLRWPVIYYLYLIDAGWGLLSTLITIAMTGNLAFALIGTGLSLLRLALVFRLGDDFAYDRQRILLQVDWRIRDGPPLLMQADKYARRQMWALSALYLRRSMAWLPDRIGPRLTLALTCTRFKRYDLAALALEDARAIDPTNPQLQELQALVDAAGGG